MSKNLKITLSTIIIAVVLLGGYLFYRGIIIHKENGASAWYSGKGLSNKVGAKVDDMYLDTDSNDVYKPTKKGWVVIGSIKNDNPGMPKISINKDGYWTINDVNTGVKSTIDKTDASIFDVRIDKNDYWVVNGANTGVLSTGTLGRTGHKGNTPVISISNDGYWVINDTTTSIKVEALNGTIGKDGCKWIVGIELPTAATQNVIFLDKTTYDISQYNGTDWVLIRNINVEELPGTSSKSKSIFVHLSFDDVEKCFNNLKNNNYNSLFDEPFFKFLKELHDTYGAKFSLYTYNDAISDVSDKYKDEFLKNSNWLKIGLHADNSSSSYQNTSYSSALSSWNTFVDNVVRITGTYMSIDRMPRLHYFAGNEEALKGFRDANYGAIGFLSSDENRISYYFDRNLSNYLYDNDHITDNVNGLVFISTDIRADWFLTNFSSNNQYKSPTKSNMYDELVYRFSNPNYSKSLSSYIIFGHEWQFYSENVVSDLGKSLFGDACKFTHDYGLDFAYPQNRTFYLTPKDINPTGSSGSDGSN